jgi:hypothetical protein
MTSQHLSSYCIGSNGCVAARVFHSRVMGSRVCPGEVTQLVIKCIDGCRDECIAVTHHFGFWSRGALMVLGCSMHPASRHVLDPLKMQAILPLWSAGMRGATAAHAQEKSTRPRHCPCGGCSLWEHLATSGWRRRHEGPSGGGVSTCPHRAGGFAGAARSWQLEGGRSLQRGFPWRRLAPSSMMFMPRHGLFRAGVQMQ